MTLMELKKLTKRSAALLMKELSKLTNQSAELLTNCQ
jgi:hypothetical protein